MMDENYKMFLMLEEYTPFYCNKSASVNLTNINCFLGQGKQINVILRTVGNAYWILNTCTGFLEKICR
jgi:hypothetical protein